MVKELEETIFDYINGEPDPDKADTLLLKTITEAMEVNLPLKFVKLRNVDKRFFTAELKQIDRQRKREYSRHGKTEKFFRLKERFCELYTKASKEDLKKNVDELIKSRPGLAHKTLKLMGARPGEDDDSTPIELPEFKDRDLTREEIAEEIGNYFVKRPDQRPDSSQDR